jgi:hypothetical protein
MKVGPWRCGADAKVLLARTLADTFCEAEGDNLVWIVRVLGSSRRAAWIVCASCVRVCVGSGDGRGRNGAAVGVWTLMLAYMLMTGVPGQRVTAGLCMCMCVCGGGGGDLERGCK